MPGFNFHFLIVNSTRILYLSSHSVCLSVCGRNCDIVPFLHNTMWYKYKHTDTACGFSKVMEHHSSNSATKNPDGEILETKRAFRDPLVSFSMPFEIMGLMYHWAGHTAWAPKGRKEQSLAGPKDRQLEVWAQRASRLLCAIFLESRGYNDIQILPLTFLYLFSDFSLSLFVPTFFRRFFRLFCRSVFLDAIAPPSSYPCQWVGHWLIVSDLEIAIASPSFAS